MEARLNAEERLTARLSMKSVEARSPEWLVEGAKASWRACRGAAREDFGMVASSIAFSSFLSILPLLAMAALVYSAFAEPHEVVANLRRLIEVIPAKARGLIDASLGEALLERDGRSQSFAISVALLVYSASRAGRSLLYGLNVAYRIDRRRSFLARRLTSILIVVVAALLITGALTAISIFSFIARFLPELPLASELSRLLFWTVAAAGGTAGLSLIYRFGPARELAPWGEVVPGAVLATLLWLVATALFSLYLARFGSFGTVYGSLGAIVLLQFWLLALALAFLLGARFNVEFARKPVEVSDDDP